MIVRKDQITKIGSIDIPEDSQERATTGRVLAVGPEVFGIEIGDRVLYGMWDGMTTVIDGDLKNKVVVMAMKCIRAVIAEKDDGVAADLSS